MSTPGKIVILGSGGHALAVWDACLSAGFEAIGFVDPNRPASQLQGLPVVQDLSGLRLSDVNVAIGIGDNLTRERSQAVLRREHPEIRVPAIVHKTAWVSPSATVGAGTVVLAQASIGPLARVGDGALVNSGASLDHESFLDNFASLGPGAHTGGRVVIGARTMVGLNAGILQGISVGSDSVIGAHSLVRKDVPANTVAYGVPCVPVRIRSANDTYY